MIIGYAILFVLLVILIKQNKGRLDYLYKQIMIFFSVIITVLFISFITNTVFYVLYKQNYIDAIKPERDLSEQHQLEGLIAVTLYVHTIIESAFNVLFICQVISWRTNEKNNEKLLKEAYQAEEEAALEHLFNRTEDSDEEASDEN